MAKKRTKKWKNQNAWERTRTVGGGALRLATTTGSAANNSRVASYVKSKRQQRKESRENIKTAAKAEKERRQANRAAILEAHNNGGFVESDTNGNIKYVGQRRAKVTEHRRQLASGETITVAKNGMTKGLVALLFLLLLPAAARAQAQPCLLTGGEPPITVLVAPEMNLTEYHLLKSAMGHDDLMEHEFLKVLRSYCPDDLQGVDKLSLHIDHQPTALILHESTAAAQRAAYADAQRDHGSYTVYADPPEEGIGILYHANGWRMDTNGDWRSPTGGYAPTDPRHDPFQNMPDCWHTQSCNGPAPTAEQTRAGLLAVRDYAVTVATGPEVIDGSGPEPTAEPPVSNEFLEQNSFSKRWQWITSFCGTIVLVVTLIVLVAAGVWMTGRLRKQEAETTKAAGKYGLGTYNTQAKAAS